MPIMPKMPDFKKVSLKNKIAEKCNLVSTYGKCPGDDTTNCKICALSSVENYKKWRAEKPKNDPESTLIKWPMSDKELFFIMPRVSMNAMPDKWKNEIVDLLYEFETNDFCEAFGNETKFNRNLHVRVTENGRFVKIPDVFKNFGK